MPEDGGRERVDSGSPRAALVKRYGEILAVDAVDLNVEPGDIYGFLGLYGYLTGRKNLELFAAFDGGDAASRIDQVLGRRRVAAPQRRTRWAATRRG
jgi:ABC-type multidrug transport system ATPase subunit